MIIDVKENDIIYIKKIIMNIQILLLILTIRILYENYEQLFPILKALLGNNYN